MIIDFTTRKVVSDSSLSAVQDKSQQTINHPNTDNTETSSSPVPEPVSVAISPKAVQYNMQDLCQRDRLHYIAAVRRHLNGHCKLDAVETENLLDEEHFNIFMVIRNGAILDFQIFDPFRFFIDDTIVKDLQYPGCTHWMLGVCDDSHTMYKHGIQALDMEAIMDMQAVFSIESWRNSYSDGRDLSELISIFNM